MVLGSVIIGGKSYDSPYSASVFKSTDDGLSWQTNSLTANTGTIYSVAVHPSGKNILFAAGSEMVLNKNQYALFKSTDAGSSWIRCGLAGEGELRAITFDSKNANRLYLGSSNGVLTSTDGGTTWQNPPVSLSQWTNCLLADPDTANKVFAGTGSGVYVTTNGGISWDAMNAGLTSSTVQSLHLDPVHNILYAGTNGGGVFRMSIPTGVANRDAMKPEQFILHQNHPNPFNPATTIRYELNQTENIRLSILNVNGKLVRLLVDGIQSNGLKKVMWDGKDESGEAVPSGLYFCFLKTETMSAARKMVYQK